MFDLTTKLMNRKYWYWNTESVCSHQLLKALLVVYAGMSVGQFFLLNLAKNRHCW